MDLRSVAPSILFALFVFVGTACAGLSDDTTDPILTTEDDGVSYSLRFAAFEVDGREDESDSNCSARSIYEFPTDLFTRAQREQGAVVLHAIGGAYTFIMVALICNNYFLPCIDCICTDLKISQDVAAATFMAVATSSPELFVNLIGTFLTESDLGIGAVVGSGVFNIYGVAACAGLAAAKDIPVDWWPLSRDCFIYTLCIGILTSVMWDGLITWREATVLMVMYVVYFIVLFCNPYISPKAHKFVASFNKNKTLAETPNAEKDVHNPITGTYRPFFHGELALEYRKSLTNSMKKGGKDVEAVTVEEKYIEPDTPFTLSTGKWYWQVWWWFIWPLSFLLFVTIPDCRFRKLRNFYPLTFIMCVVWIALTAYFNSWMITVVGDTIGISDAIMGLTFLAFGGSMPEAASTILMSLQGSGEMGLSNAIGGNTMDILLCLGLPWLIKTTLHSTNIVIVSSTINYSILALMPIVVLMYGVIAYQGFSLGKKVGFGCLVMYAVYLTLAILVESNVFFLVNLPMCDPTD